MFDQIAAELTKFGIAGVFIMYLIYQLREAGKVNAALTDDLKTCLEKRVTEAVKTITVSGEQTAAHSKMAASVETLSGAVDRACDLMEKDAPQHRPARR